MGGSYTRRMSGRMRRAGLVMAGAVLVVWAGCAGDARVSDPMADALSPTLANGKRVSAIGASVGMVERGEVERGAWREAMKKIAWSAATYSGVRIAAMDALVLDDEADSRSMLGLIVAREPQQAVVDWIATRAMEGGWVEMTGALVRRWSVPSAGREGPERIERRAVEALHPGRPVTEVVFEEFARPAPKGNVLEERRRTDAWAVLCRVDEDGSQTRALLARMDGDAGGDAVTGALVLGARELRAVARTGEQLEWLLALREPERRAWWDEAAGVIAGLRAEQVEGFELRHASAVVWAKERRSAWLSAGREELLGELRARLAGRTAHQRLADQSEGMWAKRESLEHNEAQLVWGDVLLMLIATEAMADAGVVASIGEQVAADRKDTSTEYGGVLAAWGEGFAAQSFPPRPAQRMGDNRFVASAELLAGGRTALLDYHFHARLADEKEYAGPSGGDKEYARVLGRSCLVFTSIRKGLLGVDYYQPNGATVDLGEIVIVEE